MLPIVVTIKDANGNPVGGEGVTLKRVQAKSRSGDLCILQYRR